MKKLYFNKPKRLFTFGCSFTSHSWATWANILGYELDCEFYNFGRSGAGNQYISMTVSQADNFYKFNENDLVIVCWSGLNREDRYLNNKGWLTPGNIFNQHIIDSEFVEKWADCVFYSLRDLTLINLTYKLLKNKTQFHMLQMYEINNIKHYFVFEEEHNIGEKINAIKELSKNTLKEIYPSFFHVLWNNDMKIKFNQVRKTMPRQFNDLHPSIIEHYEFLTKTFEYDFSEKTVHKVNEISKEVFDFIHHYFNSEKDPMELSNALYNKRDIFKIRKGDQKPEILEILF